MQLPGTLVYHPCLLFVLYRPSTSGPPPPPAAGEHPSKPARPSEPAAAAAAAPAAEPAGKLEPALAAGISAQEASAKIKGLLMEAYVVRDAAEAVVCLKELADASADMAAAVEVAFTVSLDMKGADWEVLAQILSQAASEGVLSSTDLESGAQQLLANLDDLRVDAPKAPSQVGAVLGELVAAGAVGLKPVAEAIRTADANPEEIQVGSSCFLQPPFHTRMMAAPAAWWCCAGWGLCCAWWWCYTASAALGSGGPHGLCPLLIRATHLLLSGAG